MLTTFYQSESKKIALSILNMFEPEAVDLIEGTNIDHAICDRQGNSSVAFALRLLSQLHKELYTFGRIGTTSPKTIPQFFG